MSWNEGCNQKCFILVLITTLLIILYSVGMKVWGNSVTTYTQGLQESCRPAFPVKVREEIHTAIKENSTAVMDKLIPGGHYKPINCESKHRVAVIVPYRDRESHLQIFLKHMHPFLQRQNLDYAIYVVEMLPGVKFNRAMLMNIGFVESSRQYGYQCFIFHDVDLLPENDHIRYTCTSSPAHLSAAIDSKHYKMPYDSYFGGVCAISKEHFEMINGFSNMYFDWGGEDDDIQNRLKLSNLKVRRLSSDVGRYKMLPHENAKQNPDKEKLLNTMKTRYRIDGLNSLKYRLVKYELKPLYTWILVGINETTVLGKNAVISHIT